MSEEVELNITPFSTSALIASDFADCKEKIHEVVTDMYGDMRITLTKYIVSQQLESITVSYYEDWLDAFKARWFPRWHLRRYPVYKKEVTVNALALFPKIKIPENQHGVVLIRNDRSYNEFYEELR